MDITIRLTGHREIDKVLRQLPREMNHKLLQSAHASAAKILVDAEKLSAPEGPTGNLIDSIGITRTPIRKANALGQIYIGPRRGRYKGHAAHLVEFGTNRRSTKQGANRGVMTPRPFARPSWDRTKTRVEGAIAGHLARHLRNFMRRTIRKYG